MKLKSFVLENAQFLAAASVDFMNHKIHTWQNFLKKIIDSHHM